MRVFTKELTITDLEQQDLNEPYSIVYTQDFGIPADQFIRYTESIGGMANIEIAPNVPFDDKLQILKDYITDGENVFSSTLNQTTRNLIKLHKGVKEDLIDDEIFDFSDLIKIGAMLKEEINSLSDQLDSIFFLVLLMVKSGGQTYQQIRQVYPDKFISDDRVIGCLIPLIADEETFELFRFGVNQKPILYTALFAADEKRVVRLLQHSFIYSILAFMKTKYADKFLETVGLTAESSTQSAMLGLLKN